MNCLSKNLRRLLHPSFQGSSALTSKQQFASYDKSPDIVVAGGGLIGTAAALAISKSKALSHLNVLLLENTKEAISKTPAKESEYYTRVIAVNNSTKEFFESVGVWDNIAKVRYGPAKGMCVWDSTFDKNSRKADNSLFSSPSSLMELSVEDAQSSTPKEGLFYIVENDLIVGELTSKAKEEENIHISYETKLKGWNFDESTRNMKLAVESADSESQISTQLLIGADGANSGVRKSMRSQNAYIAKSYGRFGVVAVLTLQDQGPNDVAWQKFTPSGPIALLPLSPTKSSLVWTLPDNEAKRISKLQEEEFITELISNIDYSKAPEFSRQDRPIPIIEGVHNVAAFPLGLGHSSRYAEDGVALVGDAAHRVHPLAGQGANLGFGDVTSLVRHLEISTLEGRKIGHYHRCLADYETERQRFNVPMIMGIDFLQQIYSFENPLVSNVRNLGVNLVNSSPFLKKYISAFAA